MRYVCLRTSNALFYFASWLFFGGWCVLKIGKLFFSAVYSIRCGFVYAEKSLIRAFSLFISLLSNFQHSQKQKACIIAIIDEMYATFGLFVYFSLFIPLLSHTFSSHILSDTHIQRFQSLIRQTTP